MAKLALQKTIPYKNRCDFECDVVIVTVTVIGAHCSILLKTRHMFTAHNSIRDSR